MLILGIETSCDETAAALLKIEDSQPKILSNVVSSQERFHKKYGGVVPEIAARKHTEKIFDIIGRALGRYKMKDLNLVAATDGPGLVTSLRVGILAAQSLAYLADKPLVGVNHLEGHLLSPFLNNKDIKFPALGLVVSGGHTELIFVKNFCQYKLLGETRDDAAGEAFDKVAKMLGLGYPGGPAVSKIARQFLKRKNQIPNSKFQKDFKIQDSISKIPLPRPMINSKDFDFSFAGLKTAALYLIKKINQKDLKKIKPAIAWEFQQAVIDVLVFKTLRAAKKFEVKSILLGGGVSANEELRGQMGEAIEKELPGVKYFIPTLEHTGDNAAMIALAGYHQYRRRRKNEVFDIAAEPNLRL